MTTEEFIKTLTLSGYSNKETAMQYIAKNPKEDYTEDDIIAVYHMYKHLKG